MIDRVNDPDYRALMEAERERCDRHLEEIEDPKAVLKELFNLLRGHRK